jgi:hypothetical protein
MLFLNLRMRQIEWRRCQVMELSSKGYNQSEIAKKLQLPKWTISEDIDYLREQSKKNIRRYIDETLPFEYEKCFVGLKSILKESSKIVEQSEDKREKIQPLSLAEDCIEKISELLTHATVVDEAIKFVSTHKSQEKYIKINENIDDTILNCVNKKVESINTFNKVF